jgi:hypothetical protein
VTGRSRAEKVQLIRASAANLDYFFSKLDDASWLPFLLEQGFFENPIAPETGTTDEGQAWYRYPNWPESQYLARIAAEAPQQVVEAIERIPETANPRVHQDVITAATALPGELAAQVARREQRWLARYEGHLVSLPGPAGDLLAHLAREGQMKAAFSLAGTLLKIVVDPRFENQTSHHRAIDLVGDWEYGEILEAAWPPMMAAEPRRAFSFLCYRLADVIRIGYTSGSGFDPTYRWRAAIEDHVQNTGHSLLDTLVDAVRDTSLSEADKSPERRDAVLAELGRHEAPLFRRLELFVVAAFGTREQVAEALSDEALIDDFNVWHEYAELLRERFADLDETQRKPILALVSAGPERELTAFQVERGVTEEDLQRQGRHWRLERYALIEDHIPDGAKAEYDSLLREFGRPEHPTFHTVITHWSGPTSPYSAEELSEMGPEGVIEALRDWSPGSGSEDDSKEGLARALEVAVERNATGYAAVATGFSDLDPDYGRALLGGLSKAARDKAKFTWQPVLELCEQLLELAGEDPKSADEETGGDRLRRMIVSLLADGLKKREAEIPVEERVRIWRLIEPQLEHPDPSPQRDKGGEPMTVAINSVRGESLQAAIRYAFWIERALESEETFEGIGSLPEFAAAIDRRLDPAVESSLAIRAVLGEWFVQFVRMDEGWAATLAPRIFPRDPAAADFFLAAWNSYVLFNEPWTSVYELLRESYDIAVKRSEGLDEDRSMPGNPLEHLGDHLAFLLFSGTIDLVDDGIFARFWDRAPVEIRKHVIRHVGWSLGHGNEELADEVRSRIVETWEWIVDRSEDDDKSLTEFGAWLGSRQLDDGWLLHQAQLLLQRDIPIGPEHVVYDALPLMVNGHPREVVETLGLMIAAETERWSVLGSIDEVRQTLGAAIDSGNEVARSEAIVILNLLGARGMNEFRDLIPPTTGV